MSSVTFLHIADLHLDSPFKGLQGLPQWMYKRIQESTFTSFSRLIEAAIDHKVDFVVISGDIFNSEDRSLRAQARFRKEMERLQRNNIQTYMIHGNHDHLGGTWPHFEWPDNVHVFSSDTVEMKVFNKNNESLVHLYGFSYLSRAVEENKTSFYKKVEGAPFHIGLLHGSLEGDSEHIRYAPFKLAELQQTRFDYWALGHIHKRQVLSEEPLIIYPGNIQGRHRKETGEKGGYLVTLSTEGSEYKFIPTADLIWNNTEIDISNMTSFNQLVDDCYSKIEELRQENQGMMLTIELIGAGNLHELLVEKSMIEDLLSTLNDEMNADNFVYILSIKVRSTLELDREKLKRESHFLSDLLLFIDTYDDFDDALAPIRNHGSIRKLITNFTEDELTEIVKEAETIILQDIYKANRR